MAQCVVVGAADGFTYGDYVRANGQTGIVCGVKTCSRYGPRFEVELFNDRVLYGILPANMKHITFIEFRMERDKFQKEVANGN